MLQSKSMDSYLSAESWILNAELNFTMMAIGKEVTSSMVLVESQKQQGTF
jgi:hypothetical protein